MSSTLQTPYQVAPQTLARSVLASIGLAALVTVLFVLPAERGYDPTGVGGWLGLTAMKGETAPPPAPPLAATPDAMALPTQATIEKATAYREDRMSLTLAPQTGIEVKAHMRTGDHLIFRWQSSGGDIRFDMHGERPDAGEDAPATSYWKGRSVDRAQGAFTAPYDGIHGWYWRNRGDTPVTIEIATSGFYQDLYQPGSK
jgi:hypothetical protein